MLSSTKGTLYLLVSDAGEVFREIRIINSGLHTGKDAFFGLNADNQAVCMTLDECIHWQVEPQDGAPPQFRLHFYGEPGSNQIIMATAVLDNNRSFGSTIAEAIENLMSGSRQFNPPDCDCVPIHCSSSTCRSVVPSFGAIPETERIFPVQVPA